MTGLKWDVSADPKDFKEALRWHRQRVPLTKDRWNALDEAARQKAFTVAGVAQLDIVAMVWEEIERAISEGTNLAEFKKTVGTKLRDAWQGTVKNRPWRIETIFRTNVQLAYSAGRYEQATDPDVLAIRPYWVFDAVLDGRTSEICEDCDGTVRPAGDSWWHTHQPPLHHACRSTFLTLTEEQAKAMGVTRRAPAARPADGFGRPPTSDTWEPQEADYPPELWGQYQAKNR